MKLKHKPRSKKTSTESPVRRWGMRRLITSFELSVLYSKDPGTRIRDILRTSDAAQEIARRGEDVIVDIGCHLNAIHSGRPEERILRQVWSVLLENNHFRYLDIPDAPTTPWTYDDWFQWACSKGQAFAT